MDWVGVKEGMCRVLTSLVDLTFRAVLQYLARILFYVRPEVRTLENGENFRAAQMMHSRVRVPDELLFKGLAHDDRGGLLRSGFDPKVETHRAVWNKL